MNKKPPKTSRNRPKQLKKSQNDPKGDQADPELPKMSQNETKVDLHQGKTTKKDT